MLISLEDSSARSDIVTASALTSSENDNLLTYRSATSLRVTVAGGISTASQLPVGIQIVGVPFQRDGARCSWRSTSNVTTPTRRKTH